jgi:hypothetical protein
MEWELGKCPREIAVCRGQTISIVIMRLASAKAKVAARLFVTAKRERHRSRSKKYSSPPSRMKEKSRRMTFIIERPSWRLRVNELAMTGIGRYAFGALRLRKALKPCYSRN